MLSHDNNSSDIYIASECLTVLNRKYQVLYVLYREHMCFVMGYVGVLYCCASVKETFLFK